MTAKELYRSQRHFVRCWRRYCEGLTTSDFLTIEYAEREIEDYYYHYRRHFASLMKMNTERTFSGISAAYCSVV